MNLDLSQDYLVFDGLEDVTCHPADTPEVGNIWTEGTGLVIVGARVGKSRSAEVSPSAGVALASRARFRLPVVTCLLAGYTDEETDEWMPAPYTPGVGDMVERDDSSVWTVLEVGAPRFGNSWSLECVALMMPGSIADVLELHSSAVTNVGGSKVVEHSVTTDDIRARVQPLSTTEILFQKRLGVDVNYSVYTEADVVVEFGDLFVDSDGAVYEIKSWSDRGRLDRFSTYQCKRRP